MSEKIQLLEMIKQKNNLNHQICELEFNQKGFNERLKLKNKSYVLFRKTPLGKNTSKFKNTIFKKTIGISKSQFWTLIDNNYLIIIGVMNPISVDEHIYYVYEHNKDIAMKDGYTQTIPWDIMQTGSINKESRVFFPNTAHSFWVRDVIEIEVK